MNKIRYLYACLLGVLNHLILHKIALIIYYWLTEFVWIIKAEYIVKPLHIAIVAILLGIVIFFGLQVVLHYKIQHNNCKVVLFLQIVSWLITCIVNDKINPIEWNYSGNVLELVFYVINISLIIITSVIFMLYTKKRSN